MSGTATQEERERVARRIAGWLALLSDRDRLASVEECCLAELYLPDLHEEAPAGLQAESHYRQCLSRHRTIWAQDGELARKERTAVEFSKRILATEWARRMVLGSWIAMAREIEKHREAEGLKCGIPTWATYADYEAARMRNA